MTNTTPTTSTEKLTPADHPLPTPADVQLMPAGQRIDHLLCVLALALEPGPWPAAEFYHDPTGVRRGACVPAEGVHHAAIDDDAPVGAFPSFAPSRSWRGAGELIELFGLELSLDRDRGLWVVLYPLTLCCGVAQTPCLAVARCVLLVCLARTKSRANKEIS